MHELFGAVTFAGNHVIKPNSNNNTSNKNGYSSAIFVNEQFAYNRRTLNNLCFGSAEKKVPTDLTLKRNHSRTISALNSSNYSTARFICSFKMHKYHCIFRLILFGHRKKSEEFTQSDNGRPKKIKSKK